MFYALCLLGLVLVIAMAFFELGRSREHSRIMQEAMKHRCKECGAVPLMRLIHASGCTSGWPDPGSLKLPGEDHG
jgi:hypothetical protein